MPAVEASRTDRLVGAPTATRLPMPAAAAFWTSSKPARPLTTRQAAAGEWPPGYPQDSRTSYDLAEIRSWLDVFCRRFFASQFKRSALPNGPKVSPGGTMSPRGDWRMPSDAAATAWLADLENVPTS